MRETVTAIISKGINFIAILALYKIYTTHLDFSYIIAQVIFSVFASYYASIAHLNNRGNKIAVIFCLIYLLALLMMEILNGLEIGALLTLTLPLIGFLNYANTIYAKIDMILYYSVARLGLVLASPYIPGHIGSIFLWLFMCSYLYVFLKSSSCKSINNNEIKLNSGINGAIIFSIVIINMVESFIKYSGIKGDEIILFEVLDVYLPMFGVIYSLQYQMLQRHTINERMDFSLRKERLVYIIICGILASMLFVVALRVVPKCISMEFEVPSFYYLLVAALIALSNAIRSYFVNGAMMMIVGIGNDTSLKLMTILGVLFFALNLYGLSPLYSYVVSGAFSSLIFGVVTWLKLR
jgi:hypothetical protein